MKNLFVLFALLASSISHADVIRCEFTEPFITSSYDTSTSVLTYESFDGGVRAYENVSFQIRGPGRFDLVSQEGSVLQALDLNYKGSNGMSEKVYPYEVQDMSAATTYNIWGGCESWNLQGND